MGMFSVHQELYFVYLVTSSWARQSKEGQPVMDQSAGIKQICPSVVISDTQSFLCISTLAWRWLSFQFGSFLLGWEDLAESLISVLCRAVPSPGHCWRRWLCVPRDWSLWIFPSAESFICFLLGAPSACFSQLEQSVSTQCLLSLVAVSCLSFNGSVQHAS